MTRFQKAILLSCLAVVAFDTIASLASVRFGFDYKQATYGSWILYASAGLLTALYGELLHGVLVGVAMGFTDATVGWAVSWVIGPGEMKDAELTVLMWLIVAITLAIVGACLAGVGALAGRVIARVRARSAGL